MNKSSLLIALLAFAYTAMGQYTWVNKDSFPSAGRSQPAAFSLGNVGYLAGGWTQYPATWVNEVWAYNPASDTWTRKNSFPGGGTDGASLVFGDSAYIIGGYIGGNYSGANYLYNPASDSWTVKSGFPGGIVGGAFYFVINGIGYIGEGKRPGANNSNTVFAYNPSADSWNEVANFPESLVDPTGFAIDSFGYAGLGFDGSSYISSDFYKYSPGSDTWTPIAAFPGGAREGAMCFVINGKAYVGGGWTFAPGSSTIAYSLGDFYCYDPVSNTWNSVPGIPGHGRDAGASFEINGNGYIVGGQDKLTGLEISNVAEFGTCSELTSGIMPLPAGNSRPGMEIYPNPSAYDVHVKVNANITGEVKYHVVSIDGKLVKTGSTLQNTFDFNAGNLANGVYLVTITDIEGIQFTSRFQVIH